MILVLLAAVLIVPLALQKTQASATGPTVAVIGDSITARYNNNSGNSRQGWWSLVGNHYDAHVTTYAQSGSGFVRSGLACTGNRFIDRLPRIAGHPVNVVIVEGGRNDWVRCKGDSFLFTTDAQVRTGVDLFLSRLRATVGPQTRIIVMGPPWGPANQTEQSRITGIVEASARAHNVKFIDMQGVLNADRVLDGVHPNRTGSVAIAVRFISTVGPHLGKAQS